MTAESGASPDHNSLGKASGVIGVIALILSFIPLIGFVSWILAPLAIIFGLIALRKTPRSLAIVGLVTGSIGLLVCFSWLNATEEVGKAMSADTFNTTGEDIDTSTAPIMDASITGLWDELEANKVAAGQKYGGNRLKFTDQEIADFGGDANSPAMQFVGKSDRYLSYFVSANFPAGDGEKIGGLAKGDKVSFICDEIAESFGEGYNLRECKLQ